MISGLNINQKHADFFYIISFLLTYVLPLLAIKNTIGKSIINLKWNINKSSTIPKLITKYFIYSSLFLPSVSLFSALKSYPLFPERFDNLNKLFSSEMKLIPILILVDLFFFIVSLGKFHLLDYFLNLNINGHPFQRRIKYDLGILYILFGLLIAFNLFIFKQNISKKKLYNTVISPISKEQFPDDLFYGNYVISVRNNSSDVVIPSDLISLIFKKKIPQKTLYLRLPKDVFHSEYERKKICIRLLEKSITNDVYLNYNPLQTRIVLAYLERGKFLEQYEYKYFYYYDHNLTEWGIYGGIEFDSITERKYLDFTNFYYSKRRERLEKKTGLNWAEIVEMSEKDKKFKNELLNQNKISLNMITYYNSINISLDSSKLNLNKVSFSNAKPSGYLEINFPIKDIENNSFQSFSVSFDGMSSYIDDENLRNLILIRNSTTDINF